MCGARHFLCLKLLVTALFGLLHPISSACYCVAIGGKILLDRHYKVSDQVCFLHSPGAGQEQDHRNCSSEFPKPTRSTWNWSCSWQSDKIALCRKWLAPCWQAYRNKMLSWGTWSMLSMNICSFSNEKPHPSNMFLCALVVHYTELS